MQTSIEQSLNGMSEAWGRGDAAAYAALFTEDAHYVIFSGAVSSGRKSIYDDHIPVLTKWKKGTRMRIEVRQIRYLSDDTALVLTEGGVSKRASIPLDKVQTYVFQRQESGEWLCSAFQNTKKNKLFTWLDARSRPKASH